MTWPWLIGKFTDLPKNGENDVLQRGRDILKCIRISRRIHLISPVSRILKAIRSGYEKNLWTCSSVYMCREYVSLQLVSVPRSIGVSANVMFLPSSVKAEQSRDCEGTAIAND